MNPAIIFLLFMVAPAFAAPIKTVYHERELTQAEKDHVWHCYRYHQPYTHVHYFAYPPCRFLTFDRPSDYLYNSPNEQIAQMSHYWQKILEDTYKQLADQAADGNIEYTYVMDCMLRDKGRNGSLCQTLINQDIEIANLTNLSVERRYLLAEMRPMYQKEAVRSRVEDCYKHHKTDKFVGCLEISWDTDMSEYGEGKQYKPYYDEDRAIWEELEKSEKTGQVHNAWYDVKPEYVGNFWQRIGS